MLLLTSVETKSSHHFWSPQCPSADTISATDCLPAAGEGKTQGCQHFWEGAGSDSSHCKESTLSSGNVNKVSHSPPNSSIYPQVAVMACKSIFQTYLRCPHHRSHTKSWSSCGSCFSPSSPCPKTQQKFPGKASIADAEQSPIHHPALTSYSETPEILQKDFSVFSNILMMQG